LPNKNTQLPHPRCLHKNLPLRDTIKPRERRQQLRNYRGFCSSLPVHHMQMINGSGESASDNRRLHIRTVNVIGLRWRKM
jgi:hypothetical protein